MSNEIIFVNPTAKPMRPTAAPTPKAPAQAPAPQVKRISWGIPSRLHMPATTERHQPKKGDRPSSSSERVERMSEAPKVRMRYVDRGSRLERIRGQRLLCNVLDQRTEQPALEHLTILHNRNTQQYWIADAETGAVFLPQAFTTLQHCHEAAADLEHIFHMDEVLKSRPSETMESMGELVREQWLRERVAGMLAVN